MLLALCAARAGPVVRPREEIGVGFGVLSAAPLLRQVGRLRSSDVLEHLLFHLLYFAVGMHLHISSGTRVLGHLIR